MWQHIGGRHIKKHGLKKMHALECVYSFNLVYFIQPNIIIYEFA